MAAFPTTVATNSDLYIAVNATSTQLTDNPLSNSATTVNVVSTTGFPTVGFISIDNEIIKYTGTNATQFTGCTRGADGTSATSHVQNSQVFHNVIAAHHNVLKDDLIATEQFISDIIGRVSTQLRGPDGSAAAPSYGFASDLDTGMYHGVTANELNFSTGGTERMRLKNAALEMRSGVIENTDGSAALPAFSFSADTNTGFYRVGADHVAIVTGGAAIIDADGSAGTIYLNSQVRINDGTAANPGITFNSDLDTGFYRSASNTMFAVAGGTQVARFFFDGTTAQLIVGSGTVTAPSLCIAGNASHGFYRDPGLDVTASSVPIATPLASASAPGFTFVGDENTGLYNQAADVIGFASAGSESARLGNGALRLSNNHRLELVDGTVGSPSINWANDQDTGIYWGGGGGGEFRFSTNGGLTAQWSTTDIRFNKNTLPAADNTFKFGQTGQRWTEIWATNGTIQTSHSSTKSNIRPLEDLELPKPVRFERDGREYIGYLNDCIPAEGRPDSDALSNFEMAAMGIAIAHIMKLEDRIKDLEARIN